MASAVWILQGCPFQWRAMDCRIAFTSCAVHILSHVPGERRLEVFPTSTKGTTGLRRTLSGAAISSKRWITTSRTVRPFRPARFRL